MSLKQRQSSRSVNSKRIVEANESMSKEFNLSKKPVKSIFLTSDASHESSRVFMNNFLNGSNRSNQTSQRLNMPTSRETRAGTSSIQYYLLQEKLQKQEPVQLEQLSTMKPHRAKITSIVQSTSSSEMYSTSLDYSVVRLLQDSQTHQTVYSHRGGVECSLLINELLITGGRDCFLRSNREWSRRLPNSISQLLRLRGPERVIAKASHLFEIDLNKCHVS
jgi:WD40 repeat protein